MMRVEVLDALEACGRHLVFDNEVKKQVAIRCERDFTEAKVLYGKPGDIDVEGGEVVGCTFLPCSIR